VTLELTEITGDSGHYFTLAELRASDTAFSDATKYPDAKLSDARDCAEGTFEQDTACAKAFVPRTQTETLRGDGSAELRLHWPALRSVTSVSIDGTDLTETELAELVVWDRTVEREDHWPVGSRIVIVYEHGDDVPLPHVKKAAIMLAHDFVADSVLRSRATVEQSDVGFIRLSIPAPGGRTGIPYVDAVIADSGRKLPFIG